MPNVISSLIVFVGRGGRLPVAPFSQSLLACAAPVARNSAAIPVRNNLFITINILGCDALRHLPFHTHDLFPQH